MLRNLPSHFAVCLLSLGSIFAVGCKSSASIGTGSAADISGPLEMNAQYQARMPRKCKPLTTPPSPEQAVALVQCGKDTLSLSNLWLEQNVKVEMTNSRPFNMVTDSAMENIDVTAPVFPITGSDTDVSCSEASDYMQNVGKNCQWMDMADARGACYKTSAGNWACFLNGTLLHSRPQQPGPKTF